MYQKMIRSLVDGDVFVMIALVCNENVDQGLWIQWCSDLFENSYLLTF